MKFFKVLLKPFLLGLALILLPSGLSLAQGNPVEPPRVILKGHDPVAYFTDKRPVKGAPNIKFDWDEGRYLFTSAKHQEMFSSNPDRYAPQFGGHCTVGMSMGIKAEADPELWMIVDGKLYLFASRKAKETAEKDFASTIALAKKNSLEKK